MNWRIFSKKAEMEAGVTIDIGSKSVGGAIFMIGAVKPTLLYTTREKLPFMKTLTEKNLSTALYKALDLVTLQLEKYCIEHLRGTQKRYRVAYVDVVISSPWNASETKTLSVKFKDATIVTEVMIRELLSKEETAFEERYGSDSEGVPMHSVLERKILEIRLNGYPTARPYGKKVGALEIRMLTSIMMSGTLEKIKRTISNRFPESQPRFHTFLAVAFTSTRDLFPEIENFLVVQVGGEVSDIAIMKRGSITEIASTPSGHNSLLRAFGKICSDHPNCTLEGLLKIHREVGIQTTDQKEVEAAILETKRLWLEHFNFALFNFFEETFLPKVVFLFEERPYTSLFEDFLREAESSQFTATAEPFIINAVDVEKSPIFAEFDKNVLHDEILAMEASFTSKLES